MSLHVTFCLFALAATCSASTSKYVGVEAELVSEAKTIVPGQTFTVALSLKHTEGYHTYWINPGMVGYATSLNWELPDGFTAGEIQWPAPERCKMVGYNAHGYNGDTLLLVDISAPESLREGAVTLKAKGGWMACGRGARECCNVGFKEFTLNLKSGRTKEWNEDVREEIASVRRGFPGPIGGWEHSCERVGEHLVLKVKGTAGLPLKQADEIYFYSKLNHINTIVEQKVRVEGGEVTVTLPISEFAPEKIERLVGFFYHPDGWPGAGGQKYMPIDLKVE